jgi:CheY-like chemotaxis protein
MLEDLGHSTLEAYSGEQALGVLGDNAQIDLVITDHAMPKMTGVELADRINAQRPDLPVLLATGYAELPDGVGSDLPRLAKPFMQSDLEAAVWSAIAIHLE